MTKNRQNVDHYGQNVIKVREVQKNIKTILLLFSKYRNEKLGMN